MGRQTKVTEAYAVKKSSGLKMTVKRKIPRDAEEENVPEGVKTAIAQAVAVGDADSFQRAKNALHMSRPARLLARDAELEEVYGWLDEHLRGKRPGSMYISGAPGTGKTAVVLHSLHQWMENNALPKGKGTPCYQHVINCMNVKTVTEVYQGISAALQSKTKYSGDIASIVETKLFMKNSASKMLVLVLDEMDQLLQGKGTEMMYTLFEWARTPGSRLILIGIANALDLTVRRMPLLNSPVVQSPVGSVRRGSARKPSGNRSTIEEPSVKLPSDLAMKVMNFPPYVREDIEKILEARLLEIGNNIFEPSAIKFVATKVAASTGDMRKALTACKLALDAVEKQQREDLKTDNDGFNFSSPKKVCMIREKINVPTIAKVFAPQKDEGPLPLQQMIVLATLLKLHKAAPHSRTPKVDGVTAPFPLNVVYDEYRKICTAKAFAWIDRSEIASVCNMLHDRSLVTVIENTGSGAKGKKHALGAASKTGVLFNFGLVENLVNQCQDLKSIL